MKDLFQRHSASPSLLTDFCSFLSSDIQTTSQEVLEKDKKQNESRKKKREEEKLQELTRKKKKTLHKTNSGYDILLGKEIPSPSPNFSSPTKRVGAGGGPPPLSQRYPLSPEMSASLYVEELLPIGTESSPDSSKLTSESEAITIKCKICEETVNEPKAAKCGHVCCSACWDKIFQKKKTVKCPLCASTLYFHQLQPLYFA